MIQGVTYAHVYFPFEPTYVVFGEEKLEGTTALKIKYLIHAVSTVA